MDALMSPERNARLLFESSQARPPSSCASFQNCVMKRTDSTVSLESSTTLPFASTSWPPNDHSSGYVNVGASPKVLPSVWPMGRLAAFSFLPTSWYSFQVFGKLLAPTSSNHDLR